MLNEKANPRKQITVQFCLGSKIGIVKLQKWRMGDWLIRTKVLWGWRVVESLGNTDTLGLG